MTVVVQWCCRVDWHVTRLLWYQFLEGMSEKIKKGIEAAESDLNKEKEQREQEEVSYWCHVMIVLYKYVVHSDNMI